MFRVHTVDNECDAVKTKMEEEAPSGSDNIVTEFGTYDDFLDSQITPLDLYYLEVCTVFLVLFIVGLNNP